MSVSRDRSVNFIHHFGVIGELNFGDDRANLVNCQNFNVRKWRDNLKNYFYAEVSRFVSSASNQGVG
jgi:hypothetical protein